MSMGGGDENKVKETALEKESARVAMEQWGDYQTRFVPFENRFIYDVTGLRDVEVPLNAGMPDKGILAPISKALEGKTVTVKKVDEGLLDDRKAQVRGQVNADLAQQAGALPPADPNRGAVRVGMRQRPLSRAMGRGARAANAAVTGQKVAGMQAVVDLGRGQATEASLEMGALARDAADAALEQSAIDMREKKFYGDTFGSGMGVVADKVQVDDQTGQWSFGKK